MRLELRGVVAGYGGNTVLRHVDVVVPDGRVVALLGPNGAGKTTLLRAASKVIGLRSGSLLVDRENVTDAEPEDLVNRGVCHITEGRAVFRELTVRENLRMFARRGAEAEGIDRAVTAFPKLGLRLDQIAGTMSGGEQQMLALSRAYARPVRLALLDELSMGLAPIVVDEIFENLARLAGDGVSLLIVEQYATKALAVADKVYILNRGRIAFAGEPAEVAELDIFARYLGAETHDRGTAPAPAQR